MFNRASVAPLHDTPTRRSTSRWVALAGLVLTLSVCAAQQGGYQDLQWGPADGAGNMWSHAGHSPVIAKDYPAGPVYGGFWNGKLLMHPGPGATGSLCALTWRSTVDAQVQAAVPAQANPLLSNGNGVHLSLLVRGVVVGSADLTQSNQAVVLSATATVATGDEITFLVDSKRTEFYDGVGLNMTVTNSQSGQNWDAYRDYSSVQGGATGTWLYRELPYQSTSPATVSAVGTDVAPTYRLMNTYEKQLQVRLTAGSQAVTVTGIKAQDIGTVGANHVGLGIKRDGVDITPVGAPFDAATKTWTFNFGSAIQLAANQTTLLEFQEGGNQDAVGTTLKLRVPAAASILTTATLSGSFPFDSGETLVVASPPTVSAVGLDVAPPTRLINTFEAQLQVHLTAGNAPVTITGIKAQDIGTVGPNHVALGVWRDGADITPPWPPYNAGTKTWTFNFASPIQLAAGQDTLLEFREGGNQDAVGTTLKLTVPAAPYVLTTAAVNGEFPMTSRDTLVVSGPTDPTEPPASASHLRGGGGDLCVPYVPGEVCFDGKIDLDSVEWSGDLRRPLSFENGIGEHQDYTCHLKHNGTYLFIGFETPLITGSAAPHNGWDAYLAMYLDGNVDGYWWGLRCTAPYPDLLVGRAGPDGWGRDQMGFGGAEVVGYNYYNLPWSLARLRSDPNTWGRRQVVSGFLQFEFRLELSEFHAPDQLLDPIDVLFNAGQDGTAAQTDRYPEYGTNGINGEWATLCFQPSQPANSPPVAAAGDDQTVEQSDRDGTPVTLDGSGSSDPDGDALIYTWTLPDGSSLTGQQVQVSLPLGATTVALTVDDGRGLTASDTVLVTVQDTTKPSLTAPVEVTVEQTSRDGTPANLGTATASDICDAEPQVSTDAPAVFALGTTVVTWTATDDSGNSATATQNVTVADSTYPSITAPEDVTVEQSNRDGTPAVLGTPTVSDICDADPQVSSNARAVYPLGPTVVTWTATDDSGNSATATQTVTVVDTTKPVITVPDDIQVEQLYLSGTPVSFTVSATDICDANPQVTCEPEPGSLFQLGETTVTVTAMDASGNQATATFKVRVVDTTAPALSLPADITREQANRDGTVVHFQPTVVDRCDVAPNVLCDPPSGSTFALGITVVHVTVTDGSANTVSGTFKVTITDTTAPVLTVPADVTALQTSPNGTPVAIGNATAADICDAAPAVTNNAPALFPLGETIVTWTATDDSGNPATRTQKVTVYNTVPVLTVDAGASATADEGSVFTLPGSFADPDPQTWTATVYYGDGSEVQPLPLNDDKTFSLSHVYADNGLYTVVVVLTDSAGAAVQATISVTVSNVAPAVGAISAPVDPSETGTAVQASAGFTDPGTLDTHTATWRWGDGSESAGAVNEANGSGTASGSHTYTTPGVYTVTLTVLDKDGGSGESTFRYVVVYDPGGGFVTGGGWIQSPAGAYAANPSLTGKANFGFNAKYQHGATVPDGQTLFSFNVASLSFHSTSYQWLVVAGPKAQFKGSGTINGAGDYGFLLTAIDGQINGGGGTDKFRIKIWDKGTGGVVYDNKMGSADDSSDVTALGGGSIVIHDN